MEYEGVDKIVFIGSMCIGKEVMRLVFGMMKVIILEIGGKFLFVVFDDVDLE